MSEYRQGFKGKVLSCRFCFRYFFLALSTSNITNYFLLRNSNICVDFVTKTMMFKYFFIFWICSCFSTSIMPPVVRLVFIFKRTKASICTRCRWQDCTFYFCWGRISISTARHFSFVLFFWNFKNIWQVIASRILCFSHIWVFSSFLPFLWSRMISFLPM